MANYKIDKILEEIRKQQIIFGKNPTDIAKKLNQKPDIIRYIIKQIQKAHCNGATAEYDKYFLFEYKSGFSKNDLISISFKF